MSEATERLLVRIDATTEQLRRELKRADDAVGSSQAKMEKSLSKIGSAFGNVAKAAAGLGAIIGGAGLALAYKKVIDSTIEQERVTAQLNATLKSTEFAAGKSADELTKTAASLQKVTTYGDEAIIGLQSLLLTFKDIKGDNFDRTTKAVLDMSTAMGQDLKSSALQLGKALNDPIGQLGALSRTGIIFSDSQKEMIKSMAKAGDVAGAQVLILQELESEFGGSAAAARNTLGGALEGLSNAFGDLFEAQSETLGPMTASINDLEAALADPAFVDAVHEITSSMIEMAAAVAKALPPTVDFIHYLAMELGLTSKNAAALEQDVYGLEQQLKRLEKAGRGNTTQATKLKNEIAALKKQLDAEYKAMEESIKAKNKHTRASGASAAAVEDEAESTKTLTKSLKEITKELDKARKAHEKANEEITKGVEEIDKIVKETDDYIKELEFEVSLLGKTKREQELLSAAHSHGAMATEEQRAKMAELNATLYDSKEAAAVAAKAAEANAEAWKKSREVLSGFFFEFALEGKNAFETLYDGFRAMLTKMIADAAANQIILGFGTVLTSAGYSGAATAASTMGSAGSANLLSPFAASGFNYFSQNSSLFTNQGLQFAVPSDGGAALAPQFSWANAGYGLAGGITGGYLANRAFGSTTGVGSTLGALGGTLIPGLGPFGGAAVGSFLGGGAERLLGNLFGFGGNGGNNAARSIFNTGTGSVNSFGINNFDQANLDMASQLTAAIMALSNTIGGSSFSGNLKVGNRSGIKLDGQSFADADEFLQFAFRQVIESATDLSDELKQLLLGFDGTAEQVMEFSAAIISINEMAGINSVTQAIADFNREMPTLREAYYNQSNDLLTLMSNFDGSAAAATELANALATNKQAAYDFAIAIQQIGASLDQSTAQSAAKIRESVLTPEQLRAQRLEERNFARAILPNLTDPQQIQAYLDKILKLNEELFFSLPENLRTPDRADDFATYSENSNLIAQKLLDRQLETLEDIQNNLNSGVEAMLSRTAAQFENAGATLQGAANTFAAVIASLQAQGITVNVTQETAEVNV